MASEPKTLQVKSLSLRDVAEKVRGISSKLNEKNAQFVFRTSGELDSYSHLLEDAMWSKELSFTSLILGICGRMLDELLEEQPVEVRPQVVGSVKTILDRLAEAIEKGDMVNVHVALRDLYAESHKLTYAA